MHYVYNVLIHFLDMFVFLQFVGYILGLLRKLLTQTNFLNCHGYHRKMTKISSITPCFGVSLKTTVIDPTR